MSHEKAKSIVAAPSYSLILQWILNGELWRLGIGEDPNWGQRHIDQMVIKAAIYELANKIADQAVKKQIQTSIAHDLVNTAQRIVKEID